MDSSSSQSPRSAGLVGMDPIRTSSFFLSSSSGSSVLSQGRTLVLLVTNELVSPAASIAAPQPGIHSWSTVRTPGKQALGTTGMLKCDGGDCSGSSGPGT
ncbi:hypothetical protein Tco_0313140 [Tanacetum coccineum]